MNIRMEDSVRLLSTLIVAFDYNRETEHILSMLEELKGRLNRTFPCNSWSDDCDLVYSVLVLRFGEYGTSPRSGWFDEEIKDILTHEIDKLIVDFNRQYELEKEEEDE